jgi:hypothetical protein
MDRWLGLASRSSRWLGVTALALLALPAFGPEPRASARSACELLGPSTVEAALGVTGPAGVAGPEATAAGCGWHSNDPACGLRALGLTMREGGSAASGFAQARADTIVELDVEGIGEEAFLSVEPMPVGAAIQIAHLDVRAPAAWVRVTLSGRLGPLPTDVLERVASDAVASLA